MSIINKILDSNPSMIDDLFINEKCRNISSEVIAKTIKGYLFFGDQTKDDLRNRFLEIKEWYNNHGIQWPDDRLLGWTFTNEDEPNKEMEESID